MSVTEREILRMTFENSEGDRRSVSLRNPVENPDAGDVQNLMDIIADNDLLVANQQPLNTIVGAVKVSTTTEEIDLPE